MRFIIVLLTVISAEATAFNGGRCDRFVAGKGGFNRLGISTAQFTSSTGECSALGKATEQERQLFYSVNWEFIQNDIAKGSGENLDALIKLSGCHRYSTLEKMLKDNYQRIFVNEVEKSYNNIYPILDANCKDSPEA